MAHGVKQTQNAKRETYRIDTCFGTYARNVIILIGPASKISKRETQNRRIFRNVALGGAKICRVLGFGSKGHVQELGITPEFDALARTAEACLALAPEDREPKVIKPVAQDSLSDPSDPSAKHTLRQSDPEKCPKARGPFKSAPNPVLDPQS